MITKRKVCFIITSKIHYARSKELLLELEKNSEIELQIVVAASAILDFYGNVQELLEKDGFTPDASITMTLAGGSTAAMAKTAGMGIIEFTSVFENLKPDIVLVRGDRYEILSAVIAAAYMNITVAHIEGGDVTGTIDESVRHAITKFAHIHFTTNEESKNRVIKMGEKREHVYNVGATEIEELKNHSLEVTNGILDMHGVGGAVDTSKPFIMVMQHPVTSEIEENRSNIEETLHAMKELPYQVVWFWPNIDAGTDEVSKGMRAFRENNDIGHIKFIKYLPPEIFISLLKKTLCLVGNSSSGIKESSFLGTPVVNIGTRQDGRTRATDHIIDVSYDKDEIKESTLKHIEHGPYKQSDLYFKEGTNKKIIEVLTNTHLYSQKRFQD